MGTDRRVQISRRRRVISAHLITEETPAPRRKKKSASEEPSPTARYGARVHRRLRARWFELVPVKQTTLVAVTAAIFLVTGTLVAAHYVSVQWPRLANAPQLSRPLRLDNSASFGAWMSSMFAMASAGIGFLIYQLRRYRADDYHGQYRIWRGVIAILLILSIDSVAGLLDWGGAMIDGALAGKAPLAGGDWIRLLLCVVGFGYTARLILEMRRSPTAAIWLALGAIAVSSRLLVRWNMIDPSPLTSAMIVAASPLVGRCLVLTSMITFLRMVYREVRGLDARGETPRERLPLFGRTRNADEVTSKKTRRRNRSAKEEVLDEEEVKPRRRLFGLLGPARDEGDETDEDELPKRGWFGRRRDPEDDFESEDDYEEEEEAHEEDEAELVEQKTKRRGWFGRRKSADVDETNDLDTEDQATDEASDEGKPKKKGWFSRSRKPENADDFNAEEDAKSETPAETKKGGLAGWMRGKKDQESSSEAEPAVGRESRSVESAAENDEEQIDFDNLDWSSMSKSERRRMKKLLRRQGKDAA